VRQPDVGLILLIGRWFVFWGIGVRLGLAGMRQVLQPGFTVRESFKMRGDEALQSGLIKGLAAKPDDVLAGWP